MATVGAVVTDSDDDPLLHVRRYVLLVGSTVWLMSFVADVAMVRYAPSPYVHMIMLAIVGGLGGSEILRGRGGGGS